MLPIDICDITPAVVKHTLQQLESAPLSLGTLDAIQLGCAIAYAPALFVSADTRQIGVCSPRRPDRARSVKGGRIQQAASACVLSWLAGRAIP